MVPSGTRLSFTVQGNLSIALFGQSTASTIRAAVIGTLSSDPLYFTVTDLAVQTPGAIDAALRGEWFTTPYSATITFTTYGDYGTVGDLGKIVANAFYAATGNVPTVSTTGQAAAVSTMPGAITLTSGLQAIVGTITTQELLIGGLLLGLVFILATGKNVGALARAVR